MSFPTNPTNGQQTTINGIVYTYSSSLAAWAATTTTTGNITGNNLTVTNQISSASFAATATISAIGNVTGGNLITSGVITAGSLLSSTIVTAAGNVTGGNLITGGVMAATGDVTGGNLRTGGLISATGNISGANLIVTGNIVDTGPLSIISGSNGNIALAPNGTGVVTISSNAVPTANATFDLGSSTARWRNIFTSDLDLNNGIGDWTIVEGEDDLFLYNNKKNKTYKFALIEVNSNLVPPKIDKLKPQV
jgi:hypothetical protein